MYTSLFHITEAGIIRVLDSKMKNHIYSHALHIYSAYLVPIANHISLLHYSLITVRGLTSPALLCCPSVAKRRCVRRSDYTTRPLSPSFWHWQGSGILRVASCTACTLYNSSN